MFGWEFPPFFSGGLGIACHGLTKGLSHYVDEILFVVPKMPQELREKVDKHVKIIPAEDFCLKNLKFIKVDSTLMPYVSSEMYNEFFEKNKNSIDKEIYKKNLYHEVYRYSEQAKIIAENNKFDVIHAHDWLTFPAAINAKKVSKKPLIVHVHNTTFDRTANNPNEYEYNIEKKGMEKADIIICVSNYIKKRVIEQYGINPKKIRVVHNSCDAQLFFKRESFSFKGQDKMVLFLGRVTVQKGPDYFLYAAKEILRKDSNVKFVVVGDGDMLPWMINKTAELGISHKFYFTGFINNEEERNKLYRNADVFVMPSVSEPFGLVPIEAMQNGTPVIISKQSGVSEVLKNALKVDFWDIDEMTNKICAVLRYKELAETLRENGYKEVSKMSWEDPAKKCYEIYKEVSGGKNGRC